MDETIKARLLATEWMRKGGFGIHVSTVAREIGAASEGEILALVKAGLTSGGTTVRLRAADNYLFFENPKTQAENQARALAAPPLGIRPSALAPAAVGAPAPAHAREAYAAGRADEAKQREYSKGRNDEAQAANQPERAASLRASPNSVSASRTAAGVRRIPPTASLEEMFIENQARKDEADDFARSLTSRQAPAADDPVSIGREAKLLRDERPSLGIVEAINLIRERRGLPAHRV